MLKRIRQKLDGAVNPIMLKEMWQSVHSKVFMAFFWLLLAIALLIYYMSVGGERETSGQGMFIAFAFLMGLMMMFMIPTAAFVSLYREIRTQTIELVQITAMHGRQLVRGRLMASGMRILLLCSLVAPFAVTSFLFGGIDLVSILVSVYGLLLASFCACAVAVFFGALTAYRRLRLLAVLGFGGLMLAGLLIPLGMAPLVVAVMTFGGAFGGPFGAVRGGIATRSLLVSLGWSTVLAALLVMLLTASAANSLTFPQNRSSARTKFVALLIVVALFGSTWTVAAMAGALLLPGASATFQLNACLLVGVCSLFWLTGAPHIPHRHRVKLARRGRLVRLLYAPFRDGASSGAAYLVLALALIAIGTVHLGGAKGGLFPSRGLFFLYPIVLTLTYSLYLSALAGSITRVFAPHRRTAVTRRIVLILLLIATTVPVFLMPGLVGWNFGTLTSVPVAFLPLLYMISLYKPVSTGAFLTHMAMPFLFGLAYHFIVGLRELPRLALAEQPGRPERS